MGLITIYANPDNIVYKIIVNHDDASSDVIKYLDESGIKFENSIGPNFETKNDRALKHREETTSTFGGNDITIKFTTGCKVAALSLVNHLRREFGCNLSAVTGLSDGGILFVLNHATQWRASIPFLSTE